LVRGDKIEPCVLLPLALSYDHRLIDGAQAAEFIPDRWETRRLERKGGETLVEPIRTEIVVVGAGPGGYAAAFHAAEGGRTVVLLKRGARLGGVCLNRGCIPSKALLHDTALIRETRESARRGLAR
jgi:heterodisulfide reductase subunit A-like polyferredoxin